MESFYDPLTMNVNRQVASVLEQLQPESSYVAELSGVQSRTDLLDTLSRLLSVPALTSTIATAFRPLLLDLCARWLHDDVNIEDRVVALCLLLEPHQELFPVLSAFLRKPSMKDGPVAYVCADGPPETVDTFRLQRALLSYYRILQANRKLPYDLVWPLDVLSKLFRTPHPNPGVRYLAIRCYSLHSAMGEETRISLEKEVLGEPAGVDMPIAFGEDLQGGRKEIDGWLLPLLEYERVVSWRNAIVQDPPNYYVEDEEYHPVLESELSPWIANIHGILMVRPPGGQETPSRLVMTPGAVESLRDIATALSLRLPVLLTSSPSAGKSLLLSHLAGKLYPGVQNQIVTIHLADTSLDARSLLGSYVSSATQPGTFEWKEGVLVRAMREGRWVVLKDVDRGSMDVVTTLKPLVESLGLTKWIGGRASISVVGRQTVEASESFALFATRSLPPGRTGKFPEPVFFGAQKFFEIVVQRPNPEELEIIVETHIPRFKGGVATALIRLWTAVLDLGTAASVREVGVRELEKLCNRIDHVLPSQYHTMDIASSSAQPLTLVDIFPNPTLREYMFLEARDVFFGAGALTASARAHLDVVAATVATHLGIDAERSAELLERRVPEFVVEKDANGRTLAVRAGHSLLRACELSKSGMLVSSLSTRPFAMHKSAVRLISRIATAVALREPVLLTGETGTGKTSVVSHLAGLLRRPLISLNLSQQTESSDLVGGFKPVDARIPGSALQEQFLELFGATFSRKKNAKFEESVRRAVGEGKWKRAVALWRESIRLAKERIKAKQDEEALPVSKSEGPDTPRKRRKLDQNDLLVSQSNWAQFENDVNNFEVHHVQTKGKFAFSFVEGPLVKALRSGHWVLLDEINLASPETLECISGLLHSPAASITLTEQGVLEPVPRHPDFRLFACMNPATDVGKKDLPPNIRSRFSEIDVPPPDNDQETLLDVVKQYIGGCAVGDPTAISNVADFYTDVKRLALDRQLADGSNHKPHYSMRTLTRALTFAADLATSFGLRRSLWEGCLMTFTMVLDPPSTKVVTNLARKHIFGQRNQRSLLSRDPALPSGRSPEDFVKLGPFYLERGGLPPDSVDDYIVTPSVEMKLLDLARVILTRRFPVLIEGPTSSGKTSSVEYLARRTGHRFVRINNHEHTDIQEYLGSYVSDPETGKLVFKDGLLVKALRSGDWIVLDELNLAPTDVLEALNRLLDDNRELVIPETQEVVRPHSHFMLFATQNPPGLYAGRKVLSRAFRNRFLEVHFEDVPQSELESILCQRCRIAPSYCQRIVAVFRELQKRRQSSRVFESKHGFATLRDLFRWAGRDALGYQELAENGFMLLAERTRKAEDKFVVKDVIEQIMRVRIDEKSMYNFGDPSVDIASFLGSPIPTPEHVVWTSAMRRLYVLVARALRYNEPVLLVGETGSGKTSVCQMYATATNRALVSLSCHQNTETSDIIGGLRPVRDRSAREAEALQTAKAALRACNLDHPAGACRSDVVAALQRALASTENMPAEARTMLSDARNSLARTQTLFEWRDGPLIDAMNSGDVFLLDEISLADDSVLERLNSVLEPSRAMVLAERGGDDTAHAAVIASDNFKLVATMNPGGDYGKKELSPALRNRFTEIWVPAVEERQDLELIINSSWSNEAFRPYTSRLLDFADWLSARVGSERLLTLRDFLSWVAFSNAAIRLDSRSIPPCHEIFYHAAHLTCLDGLGSMPQLASYSADGIRSLREDALVMLRAAARSVGLDESESFDPFYDASRYVQLGTFALPRGPEATAPHRFNLQAPTTRENAMRVVRACQLSKPILLEGSPGVGKTSLVVALANLAGYKLCRINLSDQTDLIDLFGSDLPADGGQPGEFAWKDAEFLTAMQEGRWVLLDEMNLAPQAVLEGLNAVLDHRGTVYVPELDRTFVRHPHFRIFAAQNPLHQGGGRKGLPKSFVNRFTKVYMEELLSPDLHSICCQMFPGQDQEVLRAMIAVNMQLHQEIVIWRSFATSGSPWEFNLRDLTRWASLIDSNLSSTPLDHINDVYLQRFRTQEDRRRALAILQRILPGADLLLLDTPQAIITPSFVRFGNAHIRRESLGTLHRSPKLLQSRMHALQAVGNCVTQSWLSIISGNQGAGKSELIRTMARLAGQTLQEVYISSATDTVDLLGSFEQSDFLGRATTLLYQTIGAADSTARWGSSALHASSGHYRKLKAAMRSMSTTDSITMALDIALDLIHEIQQLEQEQTHAFSLSSAISELISKPSTPAQFHWIDGPLVAALKQGHWLVLDGANLCNASVLDRLNSLCETNGVLVLNEKGQDDGRIHIVKPHPNFRLFMLVDPLYGELSRAMRNRGVEIHLTETFSSEDLRRVRDHCRLPAYSTHCDVQVDVDSFSFERCRRGANLSGRTIAEQRQLPSGLLFDHDTVCSTLATYGPLVRPPVDNAQFEATLYVLPRMVAPAMVASACRYANSLSPGNPFIPLIDTMLQSIRSFAPYILSISQAFQSTRPESSNLHDLPAMLNCIERFQGRIISAESTRTLQFLELMAAVCFDGNGSDSDDAPSNKTVGMSVAANAAIHSRLSASVRNVVASVRLAARETLQAIDPTLQSDLKASIKMMRYARYLSEAVRSSAVDFSAALVVSGWMSAVLPETNQFFESVLLSLKDVERSVALTSGLGLQGIWSAVTCSGSDFVSLDNLRRLDRAALLHDSLPFQGTDGTKLRSDVLQLMALRTLPSALSSSESNSLAQLVDNVEAKLRLDDDHLPEACTPDVPISFSLFELPTVALLNSFQDIPLISGIQYRLWAIPQIAARFPCVSMLQFTPYQHLLWAADRNCARVGHVMEAHISWIQRLWTRSASEENDAGPSAIFRPYQLSAVVLDNPDDTSLSFTRRHREAVERSILSEKLQLGPSVPRPQLLLALSMQGLLTVASCFASSFTASSMQAIHDVATDTSIGTPDSMVSLVSILRQSNFAPLQQGIHRHLHPLEPFLHFQVGTPDLRAVGRCWIAAGHLMMDLLVPDKPVDPASVQGCISLFWLRRKEHLLAQKNLHGQLQQRNTGNASDVAIQYIDSELTETQIHVQSTTATMAPQKDISRLHVFWAEVCQFQMQIISASKIDGIVLMLESHAESAQQQEHVLQESLSGFCQRLEITYPDFRDLILPLRYAVLHMKMGIRIVAHAAAAALRTDRDRATNSLVQTLVAFPNVQCAELLSSAPSTELSPQASFDSILMKMSAIAFLVTRGVDVRDFCKELRSLHDQALRLWRIDRLRDDERREAENTLYRRKDLDFEAEDESRMEEMEFNSLFPTYEEDSDKAHLAAASSAGIVESSQVTQLLAIHDTIYNPSTTATQASEAFETFRKEYTARLIRNDFACLTDAVDEASRAFRLLRLHEKTSNASGRPYPATRPYNFYNDGNVSEVAKASSVVNALLQRLEALVREWPDQMVLQQLKGRCEIVLSQDLLSPVAKILTLLEQLLLQCEDWEIYANRHNTLKAHQQALTKLVVDWRRLELSCWRGLLQTQIHAFEEDCNASWFHLFNTAVRGASDSYMDSQQSSSVSVDKYLDQLVCLLDDFMRSSTICQYGGRLRLLCAIEHCLVQEILGSPSPTHAFLLRVRQIVRSTRDYYGMFSSAVSKVVHDERTAMEKEIHGFVKLASWKDVNVYALRQSAQRIHRQLHKIIRRFRAVLRQPVSEHLQPETAGEPETHPSPLPAYEPTLSGSRTADFSGSWTHSQTQPHLANLGRTFEQFDLILGRDIHPLLLSLLPASTESLASTIISTAQALASLSIGKGVSPEAQLKQNKGFLVRKRKAWSDLLRELKRHGFTSNLKPDVQHQIRDVRWVREQPTLPKTEHMDVDKGETYFLRFQGIIPDLRSSLLNHHRDITSKELSRGVSFVDSVFSVALSIRCSLAANLNVYVRLTRLLRRLSTLKACTGVAVIGPAATMVVCCWWNNVCKLLSGLEDMAHHMRIHASLYQHSTASSKAVEVDALLQATADVKGRLHAVKTELDLTSTAFVTEEEMSVIAHAAEHFSVCLTAVAQFKSDLPELDYLFTPMQQWMDTSDRHMGPIQLSKLGPASFSLDSIIDSLLLVIQDLLGTKQNQTASSDGEYRIREGARLIVDISRHLRMDVVHEQLDVALPTIINSGAERQLTLTRILPFMERYLELASRHLTVLIYWCRALFKLAFVMCSIMRSLSRDGFCQPPECEEDGTGDELAPAAGGVGLGEGAGNEDVSQEIEDESQVEGLQGGDEGDQQHNDREANDDAVEMSEDFGGDLEDVEDQGSGDDDSDQDGEESAEERAEKLDSADPNAVDEKIWGNEPGASDLPDDAKGNKDASAQKEGHSEPVAKEDGRDDRSDADEQKPGSPDHRSDHEELETHSDSEEGDEEMGQGGAPMDDHVPEANTLDLPEDVDLGQGEEMQDDGGSDNELSSLEETQEERHEERMDDQPLEQEDVSYPEPSRDIADNSAGETGDEEDQPMEPPAAADKHGDEAESEVVTEGPSVAARPDVTAGDSGDVSNEAAQVNGDPATDSKQSGQDGGAVEERPTIDDEPRQRTADRQRDPVEATESFEAGAATQGSQQGIAQSKPQEHTSINPLRSVGDTLKDIHQRFEDILDTLDSSDKAATPQSNIVEAAQLEYVRPDAEMEEHVMQALGDAREEHVANLDQLKLVSEDPTALEEPIPMDVDSPTAEPEPASLSRPHPESARAELPGQDNRMDLEGALTRPKTSAISSDSVSREEHIGEAAKEEMNDARDPDVVEAALRQWQSEGHSDEGAERMWRKYESLTHDLAYALCEQLRLILEPTLATRLKGDYRTGKRLNMKRIIPYIASDYTKDKIWLRRTRPSQREYQVLISLDDSRSMAESHSVHLAYETLALVSKALSLLEVGDIAIAKFGETVDVLHGFGEGPFTDQAGTKVMRAFKFDQRATDVKTLLDTSLKVLETAREGRAVTASAVDLWQLQIIISDGICQDHERLRTVLRKAEEQRVMVVFIVIDALHPRADGQAQDASTNSILSMTKVGWKNVNGAQEMQLERYLDSFPFEYYVVLRNVESLPEVLSGTLKQFFERISEE